MSNFSISSATTPSYPYHTPKPLRPIRNETSLGNRATTYVVLPTPSLSPQLTHEGIIV